MKNTAGLIAIGGSAGSLQVLLKIFNYLKAPYDIPILLVLHRNLQYDSSLEELLKSRSTLYPREIEEKDPIKPGYIHICPADYHVLIESDHSFSLDNSEKVNYSRPSIDVVFKSAAEAFGSKLICVLLSGANADGADGMKVAKEKGATIVVQDPEDAQVPFMPQQALKLVDADLVLNGNEIAGYLNSLVI